MGQKGLTAAIRRSVACAAAGCSRQDGDAMSRLGPVRGRWKRGSTVRIAAGTAWIWLALALGACGGLSLPDVESFRLPDTSTLFRPYSVTTFSDRQLPAATAGDLVDSEGRCAGALVSAEPSGEQAAGQSNVSLSEAGVPMIPATIALDMTECDVVKRAGLAQKVEIGNDRGERTATLTYLGGVRPGIYHFAAGRLKSMDRAPEPPPQPKPTKRAPTPKRAATR